MSLIHEASNPASSASILKDTGIVLFNVPCDISVYVKSFVRMTSLGVAVNGIGDNALNSNIIGVVENKPTQLTCDIRVSSVSLDLFTALDVTKIYFLSSSVAGGITTIPPTLAGTIRLPIGKPFSSLSMLISIGIDPVIN